MRRRAVLFFWLIGVVLGWKSQLLAQENCPKLTDLWVSSSQGSDQNCGSRAEPVKTISRAAELAQPGTIVHILPGTYRQSIRPQKSGQEGAPIVYQAEFGRGTVLVLGSVAAKELTWHQLDQPQNLFSRLPSKATIYWTDLSQFFPQTDQRPRFLVILDQKGKVKERLPLAREPDWVVKELWRYHEYWWAAEGGKQKASCYPPEDSDPRNCDYDSRSLTQLTDTSDDQEPEGIEPGNLTTLGDLTGATLVAMDTKQGHYQYRRKIVRHEVSRGRITVDRIAEHDWGSRNPGLGWGTKYYLTDHPNLLDQPGEWWFDPQTKRLYLWPKETGFPQNSRLEISVRDDGFNLTNRSFIVLDGLTLRFFNRAAVWQDNNSTQASEGNQFHRLVIDHCYYGFYFRQGHNPRLKNQYQTKDLVVSQNQVSWIDEIGLYASWYFSPQNDNFRYPALTRLEIHDNNFQYLGLNSERDNIVGLIFNFPDHIRFYRNRVAFIGHNGVAFNRSVAISDKSYGFSDEEIKTGYNLVADNLFEQACLITTDCGGLKIWGKPPRQHIFRQFLVFRNRLRNTIGWTWVGEKRKLWSGGSGSQIQGMGGNGIYIDNASGVFVYRNQADYNANAGLRLAGYWRDGRIEIINNLWANSLYGLALDGRSYDQRGSWQTKIFNNLIINHEGYGIRLTRGSDRWGDLQLNYNLYYQNGWGSGLWRPGLMAVYLTGPNQYYQTLAAVQANTPWEDQGVDFSPQFWRYDFNQHDLIVESAPDFRFKGSELVDRGRALPSELAQIVADFNLTDLVWNRPDLGAWEKPPCQLKADLNHDGYVAGFDLRLLLKQWAEADFDLDQDQRATSLDAGQVLLDWQKRCP